MAFAWLILSKLRPDLNRGNPTSSQQISDGRMSNVWRWQKDKQKQMLLHTAEFVREFAKLAGDSYLKYW